MSDSPPVLDRLNLAELVSRIERQQAETRKFVAEQNKLAAEAAKLRWDRFLAPILASAVLGGAAATAIPALVRAWGAN